MDRRRSIARITVTALITGVLGAGLSIGVAEAGGPPTTIVGSKSHGCGYVKTGPFWNRKSVWRCW